MIRCINPHKVNCRAAERNNAQVLAEDKTISAFLYPTPGFEFNLRVAYLQLLQPLTGDDVCTQILKMHLSLQQDLLGRRS